MDVIEQLKAAIIAQVDARVPVQTVWAECVATDVASGTMMATANGLEYHDVLLGLGDDLTVPEPNSKVLLGLVGNKAEATWLIYAERIALRHINGNAKGGLVVADQVALRLNAIEQDINALKTAMASWITAPNDGGAALKLAATAWFSTQLATTQSEPLQNPKVKHG